MKTIVAGVFVLAAMNAAYADGSSSTYFQGIEDFNLACESSPMGKHHLVLEVKPMSMMVKLHNEKGEIFDFPIVQALAVPNQIRNQFGNYVTVPEIGFIDFVDDGGKTRGLVFNSGGITYYSKSGEHWQWSCLHTI